jgi:hypothetical protein
MAWCIDGEHGFLFDYFFAEGYGHGRGHVSGFEFFKDVSAVGFNGIYAYKKFVGYVFSGQPIGNQAQHFYLALAQQGLRAGHGLRLCVYHHGVFAFWVYCWFVCHFKQCSNVRYNVLFVNHRKP